MCFSGPTDLGQLRFARKTTVRVGGGKRKGGVGFPRGVDRRVFRKGSIVDVGKVDVSMYDFFQRIEI